MSESSRTVDEEGVDVGDSPRSNKWGRLIARGLDSRSSSPAMTVPSASNGRLPQTKPTKTNKTGSDDLVTTLFSSVWSFDA